jgi:hypothetical protein
VFSLFAAAAILGACGEMDTILPFSGQYKVNALVNGLSLDELSFVGLEDNIQPCFEEPVSHDPDVTGLMVFLKDSKGEFAGWKVTYTLSAEGGAAQESGKDGQKKTLNENPGEENLKSDENLSEDVKTDVHVSASSYRNGGELVIPVKSLDGNLPFFPVPSDLPMGVYTLVSQVLSGQAVLHRTEKTFFFLADAGYSFESIQVHQPFLSASPQLIFRGSVIMLEAKLDFDSRLDPYIIWYNGKKIVGEGYFSRGAGNLLWKAPEQSGFFSLRAEMFPIADRGLAGYQKEISLLVSSKKPDTYTFSEDDPNLLHWYLFEGDLNDSKMKTSQEFTLKPEGNISPKWMPSDGIYGLTAGPNDVYSLPKVSLSNSSTGYWRIFSRFKPIGSGSVFSVQFGHSFDVVMNLSIEGENLVLKLASSNETVSVVSSLSGLDSIVAADIKFSVTPGRLSAKLNIADGSDLSAEAVSIEAAVDKEFGMMLGYRGNEPGAAAQKSSFTALWNELALFYIPQEIGNTQPQLFNGHNATEISAASEQL